MKQLTYNLVFYSNDITCRKRGRLGLDPIIHCVVNMLNYSLNLCSMHSWIHLCVYHQWFCWMGCNLYNQTSAGGKNMNLQLRDVETIVHYKFHFCFNLYISSTLVLLIYCVNILCLGVFKMN